MAGSTYAFAGRVEPAQSRPSAAPAQAQAVATPRYSPDRVRVHTAGPAAAAGVPYETAATVLQAIVVALAGKTAPSGEAPVQVPSGYTDLVTRWTQLAAGKKELLGAALDETAPLLAVAAEEGGEATQRWLADNFDARVAPLKRAALRGSVGAQIEAAERRGGAPVGAKELSPGTGGLEAAVPDLLKVVSRLATSMNRLYAPEVAATAGTLNKVFASARVARHFQPAEIDEALHTALSEQPAGAALAPKLAGLTGPAVLRHAKGVLDLVQAALAISDPKRRQAILAAQGYQGVTDASTALLQALHGAYSIARAAAYALARYTGASSTALQSLIRGLQVLTDFNSALSVIGVLHGVAVIIDGSTTLAQKIDAGLEIGIGAPGLVPLLPRVVAPLVSAGGGTLVKLGSVAYRAAPGLGTAIGRTGFAAVRTANALVSAGRIASPLAGPVSLFVLGLQLEYKAFSDILSRGGAAVSNMIGVGLGLCLEDLRKRTMYVSESALRLDAAARVAGSEPDPERRAEALRQAASARVALTRELGEYLGRVARRGGENHDPGAYVSVRARFLPLQSPRADSVEDALATATAFVVAATLCLGDPEGLLREELQARAR